MKIHLQLFTRPSLFVLLVGIFHIAPAQEVEKMPRDTAKHVKKESRYDVMPCLWIDPNYAVQIPFADMVRRYGINSLFTVNLSYQTKHDWLVGLEGGFLYGAVVKDNVLANLTNASGGQFINQNTNDIQTVRPAEEGFNIKFNVGKIIPFWPDRPNSGLLLMTGGGFFEDKIAINVKSADLPQLNLTYRKGYDRMDNGPVVSQFVGMTFVKKHGWLDFYAGAEFDAAFAHSRRNYDFYLMAPLVQKQLDLFLGFKVGWILPVFRKNVYPNKEIYYY